MRLGGEAGRGHTGEGAGLLDPPCGKLGRVEFADQQSQVEMLHDADEGKTFVRWRRLGRKGVEETRDISPDLLGPANGPRW